MPSGYTEMLQSGSGFKEYAKRCLRAFGAAIHMRDDSITKEVQKREPSDYHKIELDEARADLEKTKNLSKKDLIKKKTHEWEEELKRYKESLQKDLKILKNYEDALAEAKAYQPPTSEHEGYKKFMIDQIEKSIEWDCRTEQIKNDIERLGTEPDSSDEALEEYHKELIKSEEWSVNYHKKEWEEELKRCNESNKWLEDALESIENHKLQK